MDENIPEVHFLVEAIGKELYRAVDRPKYKFYIYMTIGKLPNEEATIALLSTLCNVLYGLAVFFGFLFMPRGFMLFAAVATLYIGPALVLILLGTAGLTLVAFALYPVTSVFVMCLWFFITSHLFQTLAKELGLDHDKDGDVDFLDFLHVVASTNVGKSLGLLKLHKILNESGQDPFQEIHRRLDEIHHTTKESTSSIRSAATEPAKTEPNKTI